MKVKKLEADELRKLSIADLQKLLKNQKLTLMLLRTQLQTQGYLENPRAIRTVRRNIARILTILKEKQLSEKKKEN